MKTTTENSIFSAISIESLIEPNICNVFDFGGNQFAGFTYRSKGTGKLAKLVLQIGVSYENLLRKDLETLLDFGPPEEMSELQRKAFEAIQKGIANSLRCIKTGEKNARYTCADTYEEVQGAKAIKRHKETGELYVSGLLNWEEIVEPGEYKPQTAYAIEKARQEKILRKSKWRQLSLNGENMKRLKVNGVLIE